MVLLRKCVTLVMLGLATSTTGAEAQGGATTAARIDSAGALVVLDVATGRTRRLLQVGGNVDLTRFSVSRAAELVAFVERPPEGALGARDSSGALVVVWASGSIAARIPRHILEYTWAGPRAIAYLEGRGRGEHVLAAGLYLYDLEARAERSLPMPDGALGVAYSVSDSSLYIETANRTDSVRVFRYHIGTRSLTPTRLRDIELSPSGAYYLHRADEWDSQNRIYQTAIGGEEPLPSAGEIGEPRGWIGATGSLMVFAKHTLAPTRTVRRPQQAGGRPVRDVVIGRVVGTKYVVYDVARRTVVSRVQSEPVDWIAPEGTLLVKAGDRLAPLPITR